MHRGENEPHLSVVTATNAVLSLIAIEASYPILQDLLQVLGRSPTTLTHLGALTLSFHTRHPPKPAPDCLVKDQLGKVESLDSLSIRRAFYKTNQSFNQFIHHFSFSFSTTLPFVSHLPFAFTPFFTFHSWNQKTPMFIRIDNIFLGGANGSGKKNLVLTRAWHGLLKWQRRPTYLMPKEGKEDNYTDGARIVAQDDWKRGANIGGIW